MSFITYLKNLLTLKEITCSGEGGACGSMSGAMDCCDGFYCYLETACTSKLFDHTCAADGDTCGMGVADCCDGFYCYEETACISKLVEDTCVPEGETCGMGKLDCCEGFFCYEETACVQMNDDPPTCSTAACGPGNPDCCDGFVCYLNTDCMPSEFLLN